MTYRERREARAEKLREWADGREAKAESAGAQADQIAGMIPFGQPILVGHHSEGRARRDQERIENGMRARVENGQMADRHRERADNIERQAKHAIYSDDPDAMERLEQKVATLEGQRTAMKARNAAYRKEHKAELKAMSAYERGQAVPHPSWEITNLGATIRTAQKRLDALKANGGKPPVKTIYARRDGPCARCAEPITAGDLISRIDGEWGHATCPGEEQR